MFLVFATVLLLFGRYFFDIPTVESCGFQISSLLRRLRVLRQLKPVKTEGVRLDVQGVRLDVQGVRLGIQAKAEVFLHTRSIEKRQGGPTRRQGVRLDIQGVRLHVHLSGIKNSFTVK